MRQRIDFRGKICPKGVKMHCGEKTSTGSYDVSKQVWAHPFILIREP